MAECIHGFDEGLCDICFPRVAPEAPPTVAASATTTTRARPARKPTRATASRITASRRIAGVGAAAPSGPPFASRRLYHWTHARNLEAILLDGVVKSIAGGADPDVDIAAPLVRELRAAADVGDGTKVDTYVPFALTPDAERWVELRDGGTGAQFSTAARLSSPTEYVMLVVPAPSRVRTRSSRSATPPPPPRTSPSATRHAPSRRRAARTRSSPASRCCFPAPCR